MVLHIAAPPLRWDIDAHETFRNKPAPHLSQPGPTMSGPIAALSGQTGPVVMLAGVGLSDPELSAGTLGAPL